MTSPWQIFGLGKPKRLPDLLAPVFVANTGLQPAVEALREELKKIAPDGHVTFSLETVEGDNRGDDQLHDPPDETLIINIRLPAWCFLQAGIGQRLEKAFQSKLPKERGEWNYKLNQLPV